MDIRSPGRPPRPNHQARKGAPAYDGVQQHEIVHELLRRSNSHDTQLAYDVLEAKGWNLVEALQAYEELKSTDSHSMRAPPSSESQKQLVEKSSITQKQDRLQRGFSRVSDDVPGLKHHKSNILNLVQESQSADKRTPVSGDQVDTNGDTYANSTNVDMQESEYTFMLPDLSVHADDFQLHLEQKLIDFVTMNKLQMTGHLNWWAGQSLSRRLWPMYTLGNGNCLLNAASLAMWGFQDRELFLRKLLHQRLQKETTSGSLYRRWRWQQTQSNKEMSLVYSEVEWQAEWDTLMKLSSVDMRVYETPADPDRGTERRVDYMFESLEEFHVFVLAEVLKRPIIIFADSVMRDVEGNPLSPVPFGGIYLPLKCDPTKCCKTPLMLAYDNGHFSAVVTMKPPKQAKPSSHEDCIPLTGPESGLLPMHFMVDPGPDVDWNNLPEDNLKLKQILDLISTYLDVYNIPLSQLSSTIRDSDEGSDTSGSGSLNSIEKKKTKSNWKDSLRRKVKGPSSKSKEQKSATEPELNPGEELIMCAHLTLKQSAYYEDWTKKYISIARKEFEEIKAEGKLADPRKYPVNINATKNFSTLSVQTPSGSSSPAAVSPAMSSDLCIKCQRMYGSTKYDNYCSACYEELTGNRESRPCKQCGNFAGSPEYNFYCSQCYNGFINMGNVEKEKPRQSAELEEYHIPVDDGRLSSPDELALRAMTFKDYDEKNGAKSMPYTFVPRDSRMGNHELIHAYDRPYTSTLERSPPPRRFPTSSSITLGMDSYAPASLHVTSGHRNIMAPQQILSTSRYDYGYNSRNITPVQGGYRQMPDRLSRPPCQGCDLSTRRVCSYCFYNLPDNYRRVLLGRKSIRLCQREGCEQPANNTGICSRCTNHDRDLKTKRQTPKHAAWRY